MIRNKLSFFLYGAWKKNLGDDLFLKIISERYPDCVFHILVKKEYLDMYSEMKNVVVHVKDNCIIQLLNHIYRRLNKPDYIFIRMSKLTNAVIFLGGSLYQQEENWCKLYNQRLKLKSLYHASFAIGNNFGPYSDENFYNCYQSFFSEMTDVCFRDVYSKSLFPYGNIRVASDVVFGIKNYITSIKSNITLNDIYKPYVVVSVINLDHNSVSRRFNNVTTEQYERWITGLVLHLEKCGYSVVLMGFCSSEGDNEAIDRIIANNDFKHTEKYFHNNIDNSLAVINGADIVVATRFHAMILGWAFDKIVIPIAYGNKMRNVIRDSKFEGSCIDIEEIDKYSPKYVLENAQKMSNVLYFSSNSDDQFYGLDEWMNTI